MFKIKHPQRPSLGTGQVDQASLTKYFLFSGTWVETMKIAMNLTTKLYMGPVRGPLKTIPRESAESMAKDLAALGLEVDKTVLSRVY